MTASPFDVRSDSPKPAWHFTRRHQKWVLILAVSIACLIGFSLWRHRAIDTCAAQSRTDYFQDEFKAGVDAATDCTVFRFSSAELESWKIASLARLGRREEALAAARRVARAHPNDPYAAFAMGVALLFDGSSHPIAMASAERALSFDALEEDFVWLKADILRLQHQFDRADQLLTEAIGKGGSPLLLTQLGAVAADRARFKRYDSAEIARAIELLQRAAAADTGFARPLYLAGALHLDADQADKAMPLLSKAAMLTVSPGIHNRSWEAIRQSSSLSVDQRARLILDGLQSALERDQRRSESPMLMSDAAMALSALGRNDLSSIIDKKLVEAFPDTLPALAVRYHVLVKAFERTKGDTARSGDRLKMISSFLDIAESPSARGSQIEGNSIRQALIIGMSDNKLAGRTFLKISDHLLKIESDSFYFADTASLILKAHADPKISLELARRGIQRITDLDQARDFQSKEGRDLRNSLVASLHDAAGTSELRLGNISKARYELRKAFTLSPNSKNILVHLGELAEKTGDTRLALDWYLRCSAIPATGEDICSPAISNLYIKQNGSLAGIDAHLSRLKPAIDRLARDQVRAERFSDGRKLTLPASLNGAERALFDGSSKNVRVITFWGSWCAACKIELPHLEKFAKRYQSISGVEFTLVNDGRAAAASEEWLRNQGITIARITNRDLAEANGYSAVPTTIFLNRKGELSFSIRGISPDLEKEYSERIRDLLE